MDLDLHPNLKDSLLAKDAASAIEACVHCGFCLATCPTYLDTRDERDSPRGRIYLIKDLLETNSSDRTAQTHIDGCLSCRSCETTCPSGVRYDDIVQAGRTLLEPRVRRPLRERLVRRLLLAVVPHRSRFSALLRFGQFFAPILPADLRHKIPPKQKTLAFPATREHSRTVVLLEGCAQKPATPNTTLAVRHILERLAISVVETPTQGCCGALNGHLGAQERALADMRRNIDAWWPAVEAGAEALISSATGCAAQLNDYAKVLRSDPDYAAKAVKVAALAVDFAEFLSTEPMQQLGIATLGDKNRVAVQIPCTQMHALRQAQTVRQLLETRGYRLTHTADDHLCCGSAGSYSVLQPAMSRRLRDRKLACLTIDAPDVIASANVGCQLHLTQADGVPVRHWVELLWESAS